MEENVYLCNRIDESFIVIKHGLFIVLICFAISTPTAAQHTITLRGDTVTSVTIKEDNSYCDRGKGYTWPPEMVYPPSAWVGYMAWDGKHQILLERKARRTKSTEMDSATWLHLDSLMAEIGVSRPATAADLGITEKVFKKVLSERKLKRWFYRHYYLSIDEAASLEDFDKWLMKQYEEYQDTNSILIITDAFIHINIEITLRHGETKYVSMWRHSPEYPISFNGRDYFNLNLYRHLCALMPKTFDYSYEDFKRRLIISYLEYLVNKI